jgi:hypothetical protein
MHLHAKQIVYPKSLIKVRVSDCYKIDDVEIDQKWREVFLQSMATKGMLNPILVCTEDNLEADLYKVCYPPWSKVGAKWRVFMGNNRFHWAVANGYTSIDAYEIKNCDDYEKFNSVTFLEASQFA